MDLIKAVQKQKVKKVKRLISKGADINMRDQFGTPLISAIKADNMELVEILIENGADIHLGGFGDITPLVVAARDASYTILEYLLKKGARIEKNDYYGPSSVMFALGVKDKEKIRLLLQYGANNDDLRIVFCRYNIPTGFLKTLIEEKIIDLNQGNLGFWLIKKAMDSINEEEKEQVDLLLECEFDINATDFDGRTLLHRISRGGGGTDERNNVLYAWMEKLLELNIDLNIQDKDKYTALVYAACGNDIRQCKLLLKHNADITLQEQYGRTALHEAARKGHIDVVRLLLKHNAITLQEKHGRTALYEAASEGYIDVVRLLLDQGANIEAKDDNQETALFIATEHGHLSVVKLLVEHGAEVNAASDNGRTILEYAVENNHQDIADFLVQNGAFDKRYTDIWPKYFGYKLADKCEKCFNTIIINGPTRSVTCPHCFTKEEYSGSFWKNFLKESHISDYTSNSVYCPKCGNDINPADVSTGSAKTILCSCGNKISTHPAPEWLTKISGAEQLFGAEHEESAEKARGTSPVAVKCISCGGALMINGETPRNAKCEHCGTVQYLPDPLWYSLHPVKKQVTWYVRFAKGQIDSFEKAPQSPFVLM